MAPGTGRDRKEESSRDRDQVKGDQMEKSESCLTMTLTWKHLERTTEGSRDSHREGGTKPVTTWILLLF